MGEMQQSGLKRWYLYSTLTRDEALSQLNEMGRGRGNEGYQTRITHGREGFGN